MAKAKTTVQQTLTVHSRTIQGKRRVRRLRDDGLIPGVVYGKAMDTVVVTVNRKEFAQLLHAKQSEHALVTLHLEGPKAWEKAALVKTLQHDPVTGHILHVDFHAIVLTERLKIRVPVVWKGEPVGVKQEGGVLEHFLRDVEVECLPTEIPSGIEFDISQLTVGATVHVKDLTPPKNTKITSDPEGVLISIQMPREEKVEEAAAITEPEVIREKKEEGEAAAGEAAPEPVDTKKEAKPEK